MIRIVSAVLVAASALTFSGAALAQSAIILGERPIKRTEVTTFVTRQFAEMDTNHDGFVSPAEFDAFRAREDVNAPGGLGHIGRRWFEKTDVNGDGRISLAEAVDRPLQLFDLADVNRDGVASVEEQSMAQLFLGK